MSDFHTAEMDDLRNSYFSCVAEKDKLSEDLAFYQRQLSQESGRVQQLEDETKNLEAKNAQAVEKLRQLHHQHREELDKMVKETALEIQERCDRVKAERRSLHEQLKLTQNELQTLKERAKLMEDASRS